MDDEFVGATGIRVSVPLDVRATAITLVGAAAALSGHRQLADRVS